MGALYLGTSERITESRLYNRLVWLIYAAAIALRVWRYLCGDMTSENAVMGKMARDWLFGEIPYFFYSQSHMGGWDTLLSTPLISIFGPTVWIINLWPPLISLGVMIICHRILKRVLPPAGVLAGLCYLAIPPTYWLFYSGYAQTHNSLCIMLEALLMLLTVKFWEQDDPKLWLYVSLGLVSGVGFYLNFQMGAAILPCALFILLFTWRRFKILKVAATVGGAFLGLGPMIYFNMGRAGVHLGLLDAFSWRYLESGWQPFLGNALPLIMGFHRPSVQCQVGATSPMWTLYVILGVLILIGMLALIWRGISSERRLAWLPVMVGLSNMAIMLFSSYGHVMSGYHAAYLFTLYLMLPFAWGAFCALMTQRGLTVSIILSVALMGLHFYNYENFCVHGFKLIKGPFHISYVDRKLKQDVVDMRAKGVKSVYTILAPPLSFYAHRDPIVVNPYGEGKARDSFRADADVNPLFWGLNIGGSLQLLGLDYETIKLGGKTGYWRFKPPSGAQRAMRLPNAAATRLDGADLGHALTDLDLSTIFSTEGKAKPGQGFVLDLGENLEIAGFSLVPNSYNDSPAGLRVELAAENEPFSTVREMHKYWGPFYLSGPHPVLKARHARADCYFSPRKARYLRLTHLGDSASYWTVREILLFGPRKADSSNQTPKWQESLDRAVQIIKQKGFDTVYADTWAAGALKIGLPRVFTVGGNTTQDDFGLRKPPLNEDWLLKADPRTAMLVEPKYSPLILERLHDADIPASKEEFGALDLISLAAPREPEKLDIKAISSNVAPDKAAGLLRPGKERWTSGKPQGEGVYLELDLGEPAEVGGLALYCPDHPDDYPRGLKLQVSRDGLEWRDADIAQTMPLAFSGQTLLTKPGSSNRYKLNQDGAIRYLRLEAKGDGGPFWWSVQKVEVFSVKDSGSLTTGLRK